jgi:hypothetical protein
VPPPSRAKRAAVTPALLQLDETDELELVADACAADPAERSRVVRHRFAGPLEASAEAGTGLRESVYQR